MTGALVFLLLAALCAPCSAAPVREAGRDHPAPAGPDAGGLTDGFIALGGWIGNSGSASARPDGSGAAASRAQLFARQRADGDLARVLADAVFLSDRRKGFLGPTSVDYYLAAAKRGPSGGLQVGRGEATPLGRSGPSWRYWDLRASWENGTPDTGWGVSLGWLFKNDGFAARPDGSGRALLRASLAFERGRGPWVARVNAAFFTDERRRALSPASCDLATAVGVALNGVEGTVGWEPRLSLDRRGGVDAWVFSLRYYFDSR